MYELGVEGEGGRCSLKAVLPYIHINGCTCLNSSFEYYMYFFG